jgi:hypothetical protein
MAALLIAAAMLAARPAAAAPAEGPRTYIVRPAPPFAADNKGFWVPTAAQAKRARRALLAYLAPGRPPATVGNQWSEKWRSAIRREIATYSLQLMGARRGAGDRLFGWDGAAPKAILVLGRCRLDPGQAAKLTRELLFVEDGGHCYFTALYDPGGDRLTYFEVNGIG